MKSIHFLLSLFFSLFAIGDMDQTERQKEIAFELNCITNKYTIQLPSRDYDFEEEYNLETFTKHFTFSNSTYIAMTCGVVRDKPILDDIDLKVLREIKNPGMVSRWGTDERGLYWREDNYEHLTIVYLNVSKGGLENFNKALDSVDSISK